MSNRPSSERRAVLGVYDGPLERAEQRAVSRFVKTGEHDATFSAWRGQSLFARCIRGTEALEDGLVAEVTRRATAVDVAHRMPDVDVNGLARAKVTPMVSGLFPAAEREIVLRLLERSLIFLTPDNIADLLRSRSFLGSAWTVANLYLGSIGAKLLGPDVRLLGLSEEATCFVSLEYFRTKKPFDDYVVHEAAHVFHNWKRERCGLPFTRTKEWLLPIAYRKRETFAYACETYSRILELGATKAEREALVERWAERPAHDESVDVNELVDIVREAVGARNGWKRILARCSSG